MPRMNDSPACSIACWLASEIIPASATTVTSGSWWAAMNAVITGSMVVVSALLSSNALTISRNPAASASRPMVIWGSRRRSLENPGSRNPSPWSVSKYKVDTSYSTREAGPSAACTAHAADSCCRHACVAYTGRRRLSVGYDTASTPASCNTRSESCLLTGSMIRASTSCRKASSPPVAWAKPSTSYARHRASRRCPSAMR